MERIITPNNGAGISNRGISGAELGNELSTLLRSGRVSLQNVQSGLNKVLTLEPLTSVKDLVIVGDGPAAEEIFHGTLDPNNIHTPGIYVHRIFQGKDYEKRIEQRTVRKPIN